MDLARVAAKALHNLQKVPDSSKYWSELQIARLDELTLALGDDLDSIMVSNYYYYFNRKSQRRRRWLKSPNFVSC